MVARETKIPSMTDNEAHALELVIARGELYGLEIADSSEGAIPRGTVYVLLARMVKKGFVESRSEARGPNTRGMPRKLYKATGLGEKALHARQVGNAVFAGKLAVEGGW